jgi:hypothetical protein
MNLYSSEIFPLQKIDLLIKGSPLVTIPTTVYYEKESSNPILFDKSFHS